MWCEEQDLNLHELPQRNLNPPRLPFRHPRVSLRSARGVARGGVAVKSGAGA